MRGATVQDIKKIQSPPTPDPWKLIKIDAMNGGDGGPERAALSTKQVKAGEEASGGGWRGAAGPVPV